MSLPRYLEYKASGISRLGELPDHWSVSPLKGCFTIYGGSTPKSDEVTYWDGEIVWVSPADLSKLSSMYIEDSVRKISIAGLESCATTLVPRGSIVLSTRAPIGSLAIAKKELCTNQGCKSLAPKVNSDALYYAYCLLAFTEALNLRGNGTTFLELSADELGAFKVPVPPLHEQKMLAAFLDRETGKIDALIAEQEKLLTLLAEKRQATISHAVTRGLNPDAPMMDSGVAWLGEVPAHWKVTRLKFVASVQTGIAKGKDTAGKEVINVPYLRVANVQDGFLALSDITTIDIEPGQLNRYRLLPGDVLMNEGGDYDKLGRGAIWTGEIPDCIHQNHVFAVRPHKTTSRWLNQVTSSSYAQFYFMGRSKQSTNLASISSSNIMELPLVLPPEQEQEAILDFIHAESEKLDDLKATAVRTVDLLKERRSALIAAAVTGKIDVRNAVSEDLAA
jgi:type I restriction enzyme S subunit